jgi:hypothetical protein
MSDAPAASPAAPDATMPCPRCLQLRTKMDYVGIASGERPSGRPAEWDEDATRGGTAHNYYCLHTFTVIGPDDDLVGPKYCVAGRTCYETPQKRDSGKEW